MREHADPGRHDLGEFGAGDDRDHARRLLGGGGGDRFDARMRVRRTHEGDMRHARQRDVADILPAPLREPLQVRPRHRAADIGIRPVERAQHGRGVVGDFHFGSPPEGSPCAGWGISGRAQAASARPSPQGGSGASLMLSPPSPAPPLRPHRRWRGSRCSGSSCRRDARGSRRGSARRRSLPQQQVLRGREHAGRAIAALQRVALLERRLQVGDFAGIRQALDGLDLGAVALHRQHQAAAHDLAVHPHGAGAADAVLAADMAAGERQILAQEIDQRLARLDALSDALAVDGEGNVEGVSSLMTAPPSIAWPPAAAARRRDAS